MTNGAHVLSRAETDMLSLQFPWIVLRALLSRGEVGRRRCKKRGEPGGGGERDGGGKEADVLKICI